MRSELDKAIQRLSKDQYTLRQDKFNAFLMSDSCTERFDLKGNRSYQPVFAFYRDGFVRSDCDCVRIFDETGTQQDSFTTVNPVKFLQVSGNKIVYGPIYLFNIYEPGAETITVKFFQQIISLFADDLIVLANSTSIRHFSMQGKEMGVFACDGEVKKICRIPGSPSVMLIQTNKEVKFFHDWAQKYSLNIPNEAQMELISQDKIVYHWAGCLCIWSGKETKTFAYPYAVSRFVRLSDHFFCAIRPARSMGTEVIDVYDTTGKLILWFLSDHKVHDVRIKLGSHFVEKSAIEYIANNQIHSVAI